MHLLFLFSSQFPLPLWQSCGQTRRAVVKTLWAPPEIFPPLAIAWSRLDHLTPAFGELVRFLQTLAYRWLC